MPEAVYCCFTRTTLFTTLFTVVCSLKSMCIQSFILIGCCVSELHGPLCPYRHVWPEAVYCCFTRTTLFTKHLTWRCAGRHGVLSVCKVSFLNSVRFLRYVSWNWRRRTTRRIVKMNFYNFNRYPILVIFWGPPYFDHRYPFVKTDSGLSAYCHGNVDFPNVWERC